MEFPSRCWYETENGWASKEPTDEDKLRRKLLKHESERRLYEIRARNEEWSKEQREQELRRRG